VSTNFETPPDRRVGGRFPRPRPVPAAEITAARQDRWQRTYAGLVLGTDLGALLLVVLVGVLLHGPSDPLVALCAAVSLLVMAFSLAISRVWEPRVLGSGSTEFRRVARAAGGGTVGLALIGLAVQADSLVRPWVLGVLPAYGVLALLGRYLLRRGLHHRRRGARCMLPVLAVGGDAAVRRLITRTRRDRHFGWTVVAACTASGRGDLLGVPVVGNLDQVDEAARRTGCRVVAVTPGTGWEPRRLHELAWQLEGHRTELAVEPGLMETAGPRLQITPVDGMPLVRLSKPGLAGGGRAIKTVLDGFGALTLLVLTAPVLLVLAALIAADGGRVLVAERHLGAGGQAFGMLRFRVPHRPDGTPTALGRFVRGNCLDGLPQLLNVLTGAMSLVGPRPLRPAEVRGPHADRLRRLLVKPGMTGLWPALPDRDELPLDDAVRLVLRYLQSWSITLDLTIAWRTVAAVLRGARPGGPRVLALPDRIELDAHIGPTSPARPTRRTA
jgi:lipopolysaccharide/colanic/teichoic acid biosynthesis glycosyltransferase